MLVLAIVAQVSYTIVTAPDLRWDIVAKYLFGRLILRGIVVTLELTVLAMVIGIVLGIILAVMRLSPNPVTLSTCELSDHLFAAAPIRSIQQSV